MAVQGALVGLSVYLQQVAEGAVGDAGLLFRRDGAEPGQPVDVFAGEREVGEALLDVAGKIVILVCVVDDKLLQGVYGVREENAEGDAEVVDLAGGDDGGII